MSKEKPSQLIQSILEQWSLSEPALFLALTTHRFVPNPNIKTIRVGKGLIEYHSDFVSGLSKDVLKEVLKFEATRILLCHPYQRKRPCISIAWLASSVAIKEHLNTSLAFPTAFDLFNSHQWDRSIFEFYYDKICKALPRLLSGVKIVDVLEVELVTSGGANLDPLIGYLLNESGPANWDEDVLWQETIKGVIEEIQQSQSWGSVPGELQEMILANLQPKLNYRTVLRNFRSSVVSSQRTLTRMKPNRRYGFLYMGSRRDFTTKLLVAVDVSGSLSSEDLKVGFSIINRFFKYGVESIDVVQFDTEIKGEMTELKKAKYRIEVVGRGGTSFQPAMDYIEQHRDYDGLIMLTDGIAPMPTMPKNNRKTKVLWLFNNQKNWETFQPNLKHTAMRSAFIHSNPF